MLSVGGRQGPRILAAALAASLAAGPGHARQAGEPSPVRGFVSGGLLNAWCTRETPIDVEACFSYLRAVFDVLASIGRGADGEAAGAVVACIPDRVSITELRAVATRYAAGDPKRLELQAAVLVRTALEEHYDCE